MHAAHLSAEPSVRRLIEAHAPLAWQGREIPPDLSLGPGGLGMDSIAIVELLLACEDAVGIAFPAELFDPPPITVGRLLAHAATRGA